MYKVLLPVLAYIFIGCTPSVEPKPQDFEVLPKWVNTLDSFRAVGSSPVNFQGIYIQRLSAINQAKSDLAHTINSYIHSVYENNSRFNTEMSSNKTMNKVTALSEIALNESYQVDAYFDSNKKLYVLVESSKMKLNRLMGIDNSKNTFSLPVLKTHSFDKEELLRSRCYSQNILNSIHTKAKFFQNKPVWFFRPNKDGLIGSVGIAEQEEGMSFEEQKKVATSLAKSSLAKRKSANIKSEYEALEIFNNNTSGKLFETSSIMKSNNKVFKSIVKDIWLDSKSCEIYVWNVPE